MTFLSKIFKGKDSAGTPSTAKKRAQENGAAPPPPQKSRWQDAWLRKDVEPEEVQELLSGCTQEMKSRALDMPFLLLPFRPASDPSAARTFIRNYFSADKGGQLKGQRLEQELRLTEPMVLCSVMKWCWSRLDGGVVTWEAYELFRVGEQDSNMARDAFATFIPISVASDARTKIIFDFFDLLAAIAAHGKTNGMGGGKLSRLAGWWAFEHIDTGSGFDGGYKAWASAGDATSHLFFAYLRSLSPGSVKGTNGISTLPLSLQTLVSATEYPPERPTLMQTATPKVVMEVSSVSPTPFALLRRAKHFQYRDDDRALQQFSDYEDPIQALTDECRRVLQSISSTNQSTASNSKTSTSLRDTAWSRFEDIGFGGLGEDSDHDDAIDGSALGRKRKQNDLKSTPHSKTHESGRPTTPSWADFLSSGFVDDQGSTGPAPLLLPPDKVLPPIDTSRGQSSQSHRRMANNESELEPGELASISSINLDDAFWWVWISSLAGEEPMQRKAVFGRCALIETMIKGGQWLVVEEMVRGAAPEPQAGAYIAEKKPRFGFSTRNRLNRSKSSGKKALPPPMSEPYPRNDHRSPVSKTSIGPDQHARIQAAAAALQRKQKQQELESASPRRGRVEDAASTKTNSVFTLQPVIMSEAAPAMKWANTYDKSAIRAAYLGNNFTGKGSATDLLSPKATINNNSSMNGSATPGIAQSQPVAPRKESYGFPRQDSDLSRNQAGLSRKDTVKERGLPDIPQENLGTPAPKTPPEQQTPVLSPAPLPAIPNKDMQEANEDAAKAAMVPLPSTTPLEYPHSMERKPLPPPKEDQELTPNQPSRIVSPESGSPQQANGHSASPSPQSKSSKKLKKGPGGLKGFFGKKTSGPPNSPAPYQPPDSTAIAAARAAYAGPRSFSQTTVAGPPMQKSTISRRFSGIGRKRNPNVTPTVIAPPVAPIQDVDETPISDAELTPVASPRYEPPNNQYHQSQASISRIDSLEQSNADREFHNFDQGPLEDQPAFIPHDSPERGSPEFVTPAEPGMAHNVGLEHPDDASQHSEDSTEPAPLVQDRWAQIRKNAAERAARQSEEQSRPSQTDKTDDGETSGEETIESRVARIKARVAHLTGNMEGAGSSR